MFLWKKVQWQLWLQAGLQTWGSTERQHLSTSLQAPFLETSGECLWSKLPIQMGAEETLPWQQKTYVDLSVIPLFPCQISCTSFSSSTPKLRYDTVQMKSNPLILALGWQEKLIHHFLPFRPPVLSPICCPGKTFTYCQIADSSFAFWYFKIPWNIGQLSLKLS